MTTTSELRGVIPARSPPTSPLSKHWDGNIGTIPSQTTPNPKASTTSSTVNTLIQGPISGPLHRSSASSSHRRRPSSISLPHPTTSSLRTSDGPSEFSILQSRIESGLTLDRPPLSTLDAPLMAIDPSGPGKLKAILDFETPLGENSDAKTPDPEEEEELAKGRMSAFTFGSKPSGHASIDSRSTPFPPARHRSRPGSISYTPRSSISEVSRPPSLVVTGPRTHPSLNPSPDVSDTSLVDTLPSIAATSSRLKRHSHTRSNSISLPNLKLGRPTSLTASSLTSSFPSSPISPDSETILQPSRVITSRRLKFEPSGRGAEAELAKEESGRKALEKLTGTSQTSHGVDRGSDLSSLDIESIVLPSVDLEPALHDGSYQPNSQFGQAETSVTPHAFEPKSVYATRSLSPTPDHPSTRLYPHINLLRPAPPMSSRMSKAGGQGSIYEVERDMTTASKRVSVTTGLGVLQEEDENDSTVLASTFGEAVGSGLDLLADTLPTHKPVSSRLRPLRLLSPPSDKSTFPGNLSRTPDSFSIDAAVEMSNSSHTPTKPSLSGSRHRPHSLHLSSPLAIAAEDGSSPMSGNALSRPMRSRQSFGSSTPDRRASRSGSLSYKKTPSGDDTTQQTRDTSMYGDILTPSSLDRDPPLHRTSSTLDSHGESSATQHLSSGSPSPWNHPNATRSGRWSQPIRKPEQSAVPQASLEKRRTSTSDSISLNWQGSSLDLGLQRDTLEEDRDMWRDRCMAAEAKLEEERRERAILQTRIRKFGDRLSAIPSGPSDSIAYDPHPPDILRQQLYTTTLELERVQLAKSEALARIAQLEGRVEGLQSMASTSASAPTRYIPRLPSALFDDSSINTEIHPRTEAVADPPRLPTVRASPGPYPMTTGFEFTARSAFSNMPEHPGPHNEHTKSDADPNRHRMKAWGFPPPPRQKTPPKESKRESFFGLSAPVIPPCEREDYESGVDLPPFFSGPHVPYSLESSVKTSPRTTWPTPIADMNPETVDWTGTTSNERATEPNTLRDPSAICLDSSSNTEAGHVCLDLDFTRACRCCVGEVFVF